MVTKGFDSLERQQIEMYISWLDYLLWEQEAASSSLAISTIYLTFKTKTNGIQIIQKANAGSFNSPHR